MKIEECHHEKSTPWSRKEEQITGEVPKIQVRPQVKFDAYQTIVNADPFFLFWSAKRTSQNQKALHSC